GFGADLGAEKFLDIKVPELGKAPDAIVIVATIRSLKMHGGIKVADLKDTVDPSAVARGFANLEKHIQNMQRYGVPVVVAVNAFTQDTKEEIAVVQESCKNLGVICEIADVWG